MVGACCTLLQAGGGGGDSCGDNFEAVDFAAGNFVEVAVKPWEISRTISSVMLCMAWWTRQLMAHFAKRQKRVEPPQVPVNMQVRPVEILGREMDKGGGG